MPGLTAMVGIGAGLGMGWLLWTGPDSASPGAEPDIAAADAAGACQAYRRVPAFATLFDHSEGERGSHLERATAAAYLGQSAAGMDDRFKDLNDAFKVAHRHLQTLDIKDAEAREAQENVLARCAELGY
ncbi:hypothetical protein ACIRPP_25575 [Streptomyces sp. NPDC101219]|uniref:hypothetical protein n=1 Tax=Streptomyces sp. NPDC101219 TaxID=3366131 RepID=UPI00381CB6FD